MNKMRKSLAWMVLASMLLPGAAIAEDSVMKVAGKVLQIGLGARATGMGEAQTAVTDDVYALFWNPAGLARIRQMQASVMHNAWFGGINSEYLGYAQPLSTGGLGISLNYTNFGEFEKYGIDSNNYPIALDGKFSPFTLVTTAGYAMPVSPMFSLGGAIKLVSEGVDTYNNLTAALDLGVQASKVLPGLDAALCIQNAGLPLQGYSLPLSIKAGLAYRVPVLIDPQKDSFLVAMDASLPVPLDQPFYTNFGVEYWFENTLAARLGYKVSEINNLGSGSGMTAGLGLRFMDYTLDYAFNSYGDLGLTHRVSFTAGFGEVRKARRAKRAVSSTAIGSAPQQEKDNALVPKISGLALRSPVTVNVRGELNSTDKSRSKLHKAVFEFQVSPDEEVKQWELSILNAQGKTVKKYFDMGNPGTVTWNGKDEKGRAVEESVFATYALSFTLKSGASDRLTGKVYVKGDSGAKQSEAGGEQGRIPVIYFDEGSYDLNASAIQALAAAAKVLKSRPYIRLNVDGYCDGEAEKGQEFILSQRRADTVARYMTVNFKIPLTNMILHARGSKNAAASNQTADGRAKNRRVEISVVNAR